MGKKGLVPDSSASILLTLPEETAYEPAVKVFLENQGLHSTAFFFNPAGETVTIGLVRELIHHSSFARAASEPQALIVCAVHTATIPAQNALLKIVEEPPPHTQIILAAYPGRELLPTLISRCREILWAESSAPATPPASERTALESFLAEPTSFSYTETVKLVESFKDISLTKQTLRSLIREISASQNHKKSTVVMTSLLEALDALEKNGNLKLVMEHCLFNIKKPTVFT